MKYVQINNDNNILQISDNYQNMVLKKVLRFNTTQHLKVSSDPGSYDLMPEGAYWLEYPNGASSGRWQTYIPITADITKEALVFAVEVTAPVKHIDVDEIAQGHYLLNKIQHRLEVSIIFEDGNRQYDGHKYVTIYVFSTKIEHLGNNGLEIKDDKGKILFNSNYKYLRVVDVISTHYQAGNKNYMIPLRTYNNINNMAVVVLSTATSYGNYGHTQLIHINNKSIFADYQVRGRGASSEFIPEQTTLILVADISSCKDFPISYDNIIN